MKQHLDEEEKAISCEHSLNRPNDPFAHLLPYPQLPLCQKVRQTSVLNCGKPTEISVRLGKLTTSEGEKKAHLWMSGNVSSLVIPVSVLTSKNDARQMPISAERTIDRWRKRVSPRSISTTSLLLPVSTQLSLVIN